MKTPISTSPKTPSLRMMTAHGNRKTASTSKIDEDEREDVVRDPEADPRLADGLLAALVGARLQRARLAGRQEAGE